MSERSTYFTMIRKTISMPNEMGEWISQRIGGTFNNESEYFRELVRRDQERQEKIMHLRQLIEEGEASGVSNATIPDIMERVKKRMTEDGLLPTKQ